jgi:hypothetical protein
LGEDLLCSSIAYACSTRNISFLIDLVQIQQHSGEKLRQPDEAGSKQIAGCYDLKNKVERSRVLFTQDKEKVFRHRRTRVRTLALKLEVVIAGKEEN